VRGKNFSFKKEVNLVTFDNTAAVVAEATDTLLKVVVPHALGNVKSKIQVSIMKNVSESPVFFTLSAPSIVRVSKPSFTVCDTLIIEGTNLSSFGGVPDVTLNYHPVKVLSVAKNQIKITFPYLIQNPVNLRIKSALFESTPSFQLTEIRPEVTSLVPDTYAPGDTITLSGNNWPSCQKLSINLLTPFSYLYQVKVIEYTGNSVKFIAPDACWSSSQIRISGKEFVIENKLTLKARLPEIFSVEPPQGAVNDEVVIRGKNLSAVNSINIIRDLTHISSTEVRGIITEFPMSSPVSDVVASNCAGSAILTGGFTYDAPELISITPKVITNWDDEIVIEGKNFSPYENHVWIDDTQGNSTFVGSGEGNRITIPASAVIGNEEMEKKMSGKIKVITNTGLSVTSSEDIIFDYKSIWRTEANFPGTSRFNPVAMVINGKGYAGMGYQGAPHYSDWWEFNPSTGRWTQKASLPEFLNYNLSGGASANGKGYVGLLAFRKTWWQYDPATDQWEQKSQFPGTLRNEHFMFELNNKIYIGGGYTTGSVYLKDFWEYDPATDTWTEKTSLPTTLGPQPPAFSHNGQGYTFGPLNALQTIFKYDPAANQWTSQPAIGTTPVMNSTSKALKFNDCAIIQSYQNSTPMLYKFVPESGTFARLTSVMGAYRFTPAVFVLNNRGYMVLGSLNNDMLSFDPEKLR
jgi:hypothetical protein